MNTDSSKSNNKDLPTPAVHASITAIPLPPKPKTAVVIEAKVVPGHKPAPVNHDNEEKIPCTVSRNLHSSGVVDQNPVAPEEEKIFDPALNEDSSDNGSDLTEVDAIKLDLELNESFRSKLKAKAEPEIDDIPERTVNNKKKWIPRGVSALLISASIPAFIFFSDFINTEEYNHINTKFIQIVNHIDLIFQQTLEYIDRTSQKLVNHIDKNFLQ